MSDVGILTDPWSLAFLALLFASPGIAVGGIAGALLWRRHRITGALLSAVGGGAIWLAGFMWWKELF